MVDLSVDLAMVPINTPDTEFRIQAAWRILAEMVINSMVEAEEIGKSRTPVRDSEQAPVELPQESVVQPSQIQDTAIIET